MNYNGKHTILLVEDEAIIAMQEASNLEKYNYRVFTAGNAEKAIERVRKGDIELILMDIDLGKGNPDGTETAKRIQAQYDIPVVFLSSHTEPEIVEKTEKITSYGYVVKNSSMTVLDASIKMAFKLFDVQQKLHNSSEKYRSIFENKGTATGTFSDDGIITTCNLKFCEMSGYSKTEIENKMKWSDFITKEDLERMRAYHTQRTTGSGNPPFQYECTIIDKSGTRKHVVVNIGTSASERIVSLTDITARKEAEDKLRRNEERLKLSLQINNAWIFENNIETGEIIMGFELMDYYGYSPQEIPKTLDEMDKLIHPEDLPATIRALDDHIKGIKPEYYAEFRIKTKSGEWKWCCGRGKFIEWNTKGEPTLLVGIASNITGRKEAADKESRT